MKLSNVAKVSDIGKLNHTPSASIHNGSRYSIGKRNRICLESESMIDFFTIPRLWKKLVVIIWNPTIGNIMVVILIALDLDLLYIVIGDQILCPRGRIRDLGD